ncbi:MAG: ABC transporter ATP-binding protein [Verrucomicrobia bacterium]|nr:ABC transporter ATP-binding protein [Verrucomicrobiota bacterium]MDA1086245.1 ABC transporter ATP-binding protein [Verrucomicrobiota bacterium]
MTDYAIQVENVSKKFKLHGKTRTIKSAALDVITSSQRRHGREFWALRDVDFKVRKGETLGIIGANGAGKSTLLALVAGTMEPSTGQISTEGSISSLLELGAGFHPDLSGRENVYLAGAIMGLSKAQMNERFDAIIEFAELKEYIEEPVKHYSSGMYVRLGFAVAVEVNPQVLLIDEVLAVGDAVFQSKCLARMEQFRRAGKSMLIISHDLNTIQQVSDRIMLLDEGRVLETGKPSEVVEHYELLSEERHRLSLRKEWGSRDVVITSVETLNDAGESCEMFRSDERLTARIHYETKKSIPSPVFGFAVADESGHQIAGSNCQVEGATLPDLDGCGYITLRIPRLNLGKGIYLLSFSAHSQDHMQNYHRVDNAYTIQITEDGGFDGAYIPTQWELGQ